MISTLKTATIAALAGAAILAAPAATAKPKLKGEEKLAAMLEGYEAGEPVRCINLQPQTNAVVIDRTAIVYDQGRTLYVNRPSNPRTLDDDDILVTRLESNRLCNVDIVRTVDRFAFFQTGFVSLNEFVPYRKVASAD